MPSEIDLDRLYRLREMASLKPDWMASYRFHRLICSYLIPRLNNPGYCGILGAHLTAVLEAERAGRQATVVAPEVPGYILPGEHHLTREEVFAGSFSQQYQNREDAPGDFVTYADLKSIRRAMQSTEPGKAMREPGAKQDRPTEAPAGQIGGAVVDAQTETSMVEHAVA